MPTTRDRLRAEMTEQIKAAARRRLAEEGANLSLRAVARDVDLVSSAVYRYFASRDELLTALIIDAYNDLGAHVEAAEESVPRRRHAARLHAVAGGLRSWALANPAQYALLYGSPVPGYSAPQDTVVPASRVTVLLAGVLRDAQAAGAVPSSVPPRLTGPLRANLLDIGRDTAFGGLPPAVLARGMAAWAEIFGLVSFELFGQYGPDLLDPAALFDHQVRALARELGME